MRPPVTWQQPAGRLPERPLARGALRVREEVAEEAEALRAVVTAERAARLRRRQVLAGDGQRHGQRGGHVARGQRRAQARAARQRRQPRAHLRRVNKTISYDL